LPQHSSAGNTQTSIPLAEQISSGVSTRFALIIEFDDASGNELFGGENGIKIFSNGKNAWVGSHLKSRGQFARR
jgi:hypothetical protein